MAGNIGAQSVPQQSYWPQQMQQGGQQQQPWQQGGQQQPWQQGGQQQPWQQQKQQGGQQQMGTRGVATSPIVPQEKEVLKEVLSILKEGRAALATGNIDPLVAQRLTGAHAYLCGFLEAKGQQELGAYVSTIPPVSTRESALGDPQFDDALEGLERALSEGAETRGWGSFLGKVVEMAPTIYKAGRKVYQAVR
ncbi:MAG TPA: hypothetical protein VLQ93_06810 [Myxococcaceae bacterium]|nr:hypothetical protein [Myxococcaceae bacterium]